MNRRGFFGSIATCIAAVRGLDWTTTPKQALALWTAPPQRFWPAGEYVIIRESLDVGRMVATYEAQHTDAGVVVTFAETTPRWTIGDTLTHSDIKLIDRGVTRG